MTRIRFWRCPVVGCRRRRLARRPLLCTDCRFSLNREIRKAVTSTD